MLCGSLVSGEKNDGDRGVSKNEVEQTTLEDSGRDCRNHFAAADDSSKMADCHGYYRYFDSILLD